MPKKLHINCKSTIKLENSHFLFKKKIKIKIKIKNKKIKGFIQHSMSFWPVKRSPFYKAKWLNKNTYLKPFDDNFWYTDCAFHDQYRQWHKPIIQCLITIDVCSYWTQHSTERHTCYRCRVGSLGFDFDCQLHCLTVICMAKSKANIWTNKGFINSFETAYTGRIEQQT